MPYEAIVAIVTMAAVTLFVTVISLRESARRRHELREAAARLYADARAVHVPEHELGLVSPEHFPKIPPSGYEVHAAFLRARGFRPLALLEDLTLSRVYPQNRTYVALHVSADDRVTAYSWWLSGTQYLEFGSGTTDDRRILTSNAEPGLLHWPPAVDNCVLAADTAPEELLSRHRARVAEFERREPETALRTFPDMDAAFAAMRAYRREVSAYRQSIGYMTLEEILSLARNPPEKKAARRLWAEIERQRRRTEG